MVIIGLFIAPQFTPEMESGAEPPPYVNHDEIDWQSLRQGLIEDFALDAHDVRVRLANDTVDQVTVHVRQMVKSRGPLDCSDFGQALNEAAKKCEEDIVDVRNEWTALHFKDDRRHAPPPIMIPMVFEGDPGFSWNLVISMMEQMDVAFAKNPQRALLGDVPADYFEGVLPGITRDRLGKHFGVGYKKYATLHPLVKGEAPFGDWLKKGAL